MHCTRKIVQDKTDVRSRSYFVYKCNLCNHEHWFNWALNFDDSRLRPCPHCGVTDDVDEKTMLLQRKQRLEQQVQPFLDELTKVDARLAVIEREVDNVGTGHGSSGGRPGQ